MTTAGLPPSAIIKRKPLATTARRHGWVGCNFALNRIPVEARIDIVRTERSATVPVAQTFLSVGSGDFPVASRKHRTGMSAEPAGLKACPTIIVPPEEVRAKFRRVKPLKDISVQQRGWTLDVLNIVRRLVEERSRWGEATDEPASTHQSEVATARGDARPTNTFTTADAYIFTRELEQLHPNNSDCHREQAVTSAITP